MFEFDETVNKMDKDQLSEFRNYVKAIQDPTRSIQDQANRKLGDISSTLGMEDSLNSGEIFKITRQIKKGNLEDALSIFDGSKNVSKMDVERREQLRNKLIRQADEFKNIKNKKEDVQSYTDEQIAKIKEKYGIDITSKNAWKLEDMLKREIKDRKDLSAKPPEQQLVDITEKNHKAITGHMDTIIDLLKDLNKTKEGIEDIKGSRNVLAKPLPTEVENKLSEIDSQFKDSLAQPVRNMINTVGTDNKSIKDALNNVNRVKGFAGSNLSTEDEINYIAKGKGYNPKFHIGLPDDKYRLPIEMQRGMHIYPDENILRSYKLEKKNENRGII